MPEASAVSGSAPDAAADLLDPLSVGTRVAELTGDRAWLNAMIEVELSLTEALVAVGLAPGELTEVCAQLRAGGGFDPAAIAAAARGGGNPVIPLVHELAAAAEQLSAGAADHIHRGATSQDILDSAAMLVGLRVGAEVRRQLRELAAALAVLADRHRATPMVARTLGQHAAPTTFGLVVAGWLSSVLRATRNLERVLGELPGQLGGAVGNRAVLAEAAAVAQPERSAAVTVEALADAFAQRLGLTSPPLSWHSNRIPVAELAAALGLAAGAAGFFAAQVSVLSRSEIGEVSERLAAGAGTSSAMPHKRNPVTAVLVVAAARQTPALVATLFAALPAEDQRSSGSWHSEWQTLRQLERLAIESTAGAAFLATRLDVHAEAMRANLAQTNGVVVSERVAAILAESLGKATAFELVEQCSAQSAASGRGLADTLGEALQRRADAPLSEPLAARLAEAFAYRAGAAGTAVTDAAIDAVLRAYRADAP